MYAAIHHRQGHHSSFASAWWAAQRPEWSSCRQHIVLSMLPHLSQAPATKHTHLVERALVRALIPDAECVVLLRVQVAPDVGVVSQQAAAGTVCHMTTGRKATAWQHAAHCWAVMQEARGQSSTGLMQSAEGVQGVQEQPAGCSRTLRGTMNGQAADWASQGMGTEHRGLAGLLYLCSRHLSTLYMQGEWQEAWRAAAPIEWERHGKRKAEAVRALAPNAEQLKGAQAGRLQRHSRVLTNVSLSILLLRGGARCAGKGQADQEAHTH